MDEENNEAELRFDPFMIEEQPQEEKFSEEEKNLARIAVPEAPVEVQQEEVKLSPEQIASLRAELDQSFANWTADGAEMNAAHALWGKFEMVTSDLSQQLCEQLRIILEPILATKLKGDYRTGKRINIKKVIPYIASQFRKDKIWLRRTKPNKRHYQVMIAIDNSASMKANGGGRLALEALTVLTRALSQLEVGELGVVSFGEQVDLLHPFDQPFTSESGAYAVSRFQFKQDKTLWPQFLESVIQLLDQAKAQSSQGSEDHLQLVFVISDARVAQDRELVAKWAREALNKRQLLVLIVVDTPDPAHSILNVKSVSYPNGKMKIVQYLDDFPFPYYVILRNINSLPETVADALRQWFELIQRST